MEWSAKLERANSGFIRNIGECPVAIIVIQHIAPELSDIEIGKTIVVIVSPRASKSISGAGNTSRLRHVPKRTVAVVLIQSVLPGNPAPIKVAAIHKIYVLVSVAVEIGHAHPWTKYFAIDGDSFIAPEMDKIDSSSRGCICELYDRGPYHECERKSRGGALVIFHSWYEPPGCHFIRMPGSMALL